MGHPGSLVKAGGATGSRALWKFLHTLFICVSPLCNGLAAKLAPEVVAYLRRNSPCLRLRPVSW
jgi:hypothetical protein